MGGVSPETRRASRKYGIIKFDTMLHLAEFFFMNVYVAFGTLSYICKNIQCQIVRVA
jgi:hypothetical protein